MILVIMPSEAMKERRDSTWVTPLRSMCHRGIFQLPLLMLLSRLAVMMEEAMDLPMSNTAALLDLDMALSAYICHNTIFSRDHPQLHIFAHQHANMSGRQARPMLYTVQLRMSHTGAGQVLSYRGSVAGLSGNHSIIQINFMYQGVACLLLGPHDSAASPTCRT